MMSKYLKKKYPFEDEDNDVVSSCRKGDTAAFETLVNKYQKKMLNIAYRITGNYEDACEIVQDAFVSAYKGIKEFQGRAKFSTWLYTITVNLSRNRLKQMKTEMNQKAYSLDDPVFADEETLNFEPPSGEPTALEMLEKKDIQQKVQECINSLDSDFRAVVVLRDIQGFSYDEVSVILDVAEGTVKSRLFRAREMIKNCLQKTMRVL
jgi:RNA polymerase sigma-70 factor (ECF subfamily)